MWVEAPPHCPLKRDWGVFKRGSCRRGCSKPLSSGFNFAQPRRGKPPEVLKAQPLGIRRGALGVIYTHPDMDNIWKLKIERLELKSGFNFGNRGVDWMRGKTISY